MKALPIGIQTFSKIREGDYLYIDKTKEALDLIKNYEYVFLSRPRRFGKSLFLDTLKNIFEGNKKFFEGLYIYDKYDWSQKYPVVKIDWRSTTKIDEIIIDFKRILKENALNLGITLEEDEYTNQFRELIQKVYKKYNQKVVVLIDEYDKPILDHISNIEVAKGAREILRRVYTELKANDAYLRFVFLTGISKFSKASIFSGLNNLEDISLNPDFGNICGYTHENIKNEFFEYSKDYDLEKIKEWYNGYYFLKDRIYNPFDILKLFKYKRFKNYWWESGQAYSLIELLKSRNYYFPKIANIRVDERVIESFDIEKLKIESLLFQTGYLTIKNVYEKRLGYEYELKIPNLEVQVSLSNLIIDYLTNQTTLRLDFEDKIYEALLQSNLNTLKETLQALFASIPYNNYVKNEIGEYEGYYASVLFSYFYALGIDLIAEDVNSYGRIDLTLLLEDKIYIIEFKVDSNEALKQIKEKGYFKKYLNKNKKIYLVGITFDSKTKNIKSFEWERVEN